MYFSFASVTNGLGPLDHLPRWFQIEILFIRQFTWCMSKLRIVVSTILCKAGTWWAIASGGLMVIDTAKLPPSRNGSQIALSLNLSQYQYILYYSAVGRYII